MSAFKKAGKSGQKNHRERSQPAGRAHLGILEKKKDYKQRSEEDQKKNNYLKGLKRKALDKNPDEFYFKMVKTRMEDGVHQTEDKIPEYTDDQIKLLQSQDLKYINHKRSVELKKIERLKSGLHCLDAVEKPVNKHTIFVDSRNEVKKFDPAKYFGTHPELVGRTYNRPKLDDLKSGKFSLAVDEEDLETLSAAKQVKYKELVKRIDREQKLRVTAEKMESKQNLMDKKSERKKVKEGTVNNAPVYQWEPERKR